MQTFENVPAKWGAEERITISLAWIFFRRYLFSHRAGAVVRIMAQISWFATFLGVFSLIVVSSIMNGFNRTQSARLLNVEPHLYFKTESDPRPLYEELFLNSGAIGSGIAVSSYAQNDVILRSLDGRFTGAVAKGMSEDFVYGLLNRIYQSQFKEGEKEALSQARAQLEPNEVIMGIELARELNVYEGDEVILIPPESLLLPQGELMQFDRMRVKLVFSTEFTEIDSHYLFYDVSKGPYKFQGLKSGDRGIEVRLNNPQELSLVTGWVKEKFGNRLAFKTEDWAERNQALFLALRLEKTAMLSLLSLSILITCFSLITVITMLISQKKKDIQLLIAIGFSRAKTERLFMGLGLALCMVGLLPGLVLGVLTSLLIQKYPVDILPDIYYDSAIPSEVNYGFVGIVAIVCLLIAWFTAKVPVTQAARKSVNLSFHTGT